MVNTCSFINEAKEESINTILELAQHKEQAPAKRLIVTGCLAQRYSRELKESLPEVLMSSSAPASFSGLRKFCGKNSRSLTDRQVTSALRTFSRSYDPTHHDNGILYSLSSDC